MQKRSSSTSLWMVIQSALCCAAVSTSVFAQQNEPQSKRDDEKVERVETVVVTATRSEKAVDKIAGAVSVITQKELSQQLLIAEDPSAALAAFVPGYAPSTQKLNQFGESMRGRAPLILFDGIPQSNPLRVGTREGYFVDPAAIERIEVISGASAIQGLGATGGIINYISKTAKKPGTEHQIDAKVTTQFRSDDRVWKGGYLLSHKNDALDALAYVGATLRGIAYDAGGRRIGMDAARGDSMDSQAGDLFVKLGRDFGPQRIQISYNRFKLEGNGDYRVVNGNRATGIPTTSERGSPPGKPQTNDVESASIEWRHNELAGGFLTAQLYKQDFSSLFGAEVGRATFQDASIAPIGTLVDQSEIIAKKLGVRLTYVRPDLLISGLELTAGLDWLRDRPEQRLALTNRTWVPPLNYRSTAPFAQIEYEWGRLTVRGGVRQEEANLTVDTYRTLAANGSQTVQGGSQSFSKTVSNLGGIVRLPGGWSVYASNSEGFGLPDVGVVLRNVNTPGRSVSNLVDLQPVIIKNKEVGFTWRGKVGSVGVSYFDSRSELGSQVRVGSDGIGRVQRLPIAIKGWEVSGEARLTKALSATVLYSTTDGKTAATPGAPLDVDQGARAQGPDKVVAGLNWAFSEKGSARLQMTKLFSRNINIGRKVGTANLEEHFNGYTLANLVTTYKTKWGDFGLGVENLFDKQYIGYFAQADAGSQTLNDTFFAGRGRTLTISYGTKF